MFDISDLRRKRHLALFFLSAPSSPLFISIEEHACRIREKNTQVAVVCRVSLREVEDIYRTHRLTFDIFPDEECAVSSKFIKAEKGEEVAALFLADKSGVVFFQHVVRRFQNLPPLSDILKALSFMESPYV